MDLFVREPEYLDVLADGTVKQLNPFTGTEVWTVPGRGNRPLGVQVADPQPISPDEHGGHCAFCELRYWETPPEKSRVVRRGDDWEQLDGVPASQLLDEVAEFRRVPNLFEILSYNYWHLNYGYELPGDVAARREAYLAEPEGLRHVVSVVEAKLRASGSTPEDIARMELGDKLDAASGFFGGGHDVIIARRHFVDGAADSAQLASSGTLTPEEHRRFLRFTVDSMEQLYAANRYARYVSVFQNWLKPAGASFDHLHKQLVAIDERGTQQELTLAKLRRNPNIFNDAAANYASRNNLMIAENDHAIAFAGFGHRYPTIEVYSRSEESDPWRHSSQEVDGVSDVLHAMHAATGADVACNEEWHHRPIDVREPMPWRIMLKWRVSTLAGFEGATKIYLNTIDPMTLRDKVVSQLHALRDQGRIAASLRIATECGCQPNPLRYCR